MPLSPFPVLGEGWVKYIPRLTPVKTIRTTKLHEENPSKRSNLKPSPVGEGVDHAAFLGGFATESPWLTDEVSTNELRLLY